MRAYIEALGAGYTLLLPVYWEGLGRLAYLVGILCEVYVNKGIFFLWGAAFCVIVKLVM